jgi:8-oxo-dGTP diphosphatase
MLAVHHLVAAILVRGDRILLGRRSPHRAFYPDVWDVFGGHIEPDEQPDQALVRELQEELDITPVQWRTLEIIKESIPERDDMSAYDVIGHFYHVTAWMGTPVNRQPDEHSVIQWFSYAEAVKLDLAHPGYPRLFAQCLQWISGREWE